MNTMQMAASQSPAVFILTKRNSLTIKVILTPHQRSHSSTEHVCVHTFRKNELTPLYNSFVFKMTTLSVHCEVRTGYLYVCRLQPTPVATWCKALVCGCSLAGITSSNPSRRMDIFLLCFVLSGRGLCVGLITRPEESYRL